MLKLRSGRCLKRHVLKCRQFQRWLNGDQLLFKRRVMRSHPLVYTNLLICRRWKGQRAVVALDKESGKEVWKALDTPEIGYSRPTLFQADGVPPAAGRERCALAVSWKNRRF